MRILIVFLLALTSTVSAQEDCILWPSKYYLDDTASYVFIFEADSLILDDIQMENTLVFSGRHTRIAKGRVRKVYQSLPSKIICSDSVIVEHPYSYTFKKGYSYLLYCGKYQIGNHFIINPCSYTLRLIKTKGTKKVFKDINKYYINKEANELMKLFRDD